VSKISQNGTLLSDFSKQFKDYAVATCQTEVSADGFDVIRLCNSRISISVLPELGESKTWFLTLSLRNGIKTND
jgi:hypothetical protein